MSARMADDTIFWAFVLTLIMGFRVWAALSRMAASAYAAEMQARAAWKSAQLQVELYERAANELANELANG